MLCEKISDTELVRRYLRNDESALEILIHRHKSKVYAYIQHLVKDNQLAEDLFQDVFIKVIHKLKSGNYNEEGKFLPWVMRISHNLVIDTFRKNKRVPTVDGGEDFDLVEHLGEPDKSIEDELVWNQISEDVKALIDYLPEDQRSVLWMRIYADMSFKEIAEETNVSINTALGRMRYALINLRKMIDANKLILNSH